MHIHPQSVLEFVNVCRNLSSDAALKGHVGFNSLLWSWWTHAL